MAIKTIQFLSTFPPRECGIATFTDDLVNWVTMAGGGNFNCRVAAVNDNSCSTYNYPKKVNIEIHEENIENYLEAAEQINKDEKTKLVCIQHEFGIFGGEFGDHLLPFLDELKKPVVTTFHSVLPGNPEIERHRKYVVKRICEKSSKSVVISGFGQDILQEKYGVEPGKIIPIPHGVPSIDYGNTEKAKRRLGLKGRKVISTFGLLSRKKGIHYAIKAMPKIVKKHPEALYLVIGETHPIVRKNEGETYRKKLVSLVKAMGLTDNVAFYNKFLPLRELCSYLEASDIYITPYYDPEQISSGTLAYAIGAGKACISTPYLYARDALRDNRGMFVRFKSSNDIAEKVNMLLGTPSLRQSIELNAYTYSRAWEWENIGNSYLHLFNNIIKG
jgi:glycosyltransferase involved in cell wall biosynthesis